MSKIGYQFYIEFRPEVKGWGEKGTLDLGKVLELRRQPKTEAAEDVERPPQGDDEEAGKNEESENRESQTSQGESPSTIQEQSRDIKRESEPPPIAESQPRKKIKLEDNDFEDGGLQDSDLLDL